MNIQHPDIVIRHIKTKSKVRKLVTYRSDNCDLRIYHQSINSFLSKNFVPSLFAKGYIKGRSIYHNALSHMYNDYFIMLDIKDFFPHICHKQLVDKIFREINLIEPNQISKKECIDVVESCTVNSRGLPLGFITSPLLSNIYLKEFDNIFYGTLKKLNLKNIIYTRYADDLTVSFQCDSLLKMDSIEAEIVHHAASILRRYGLQLNQRKTRSYNLNISNHVRITGINIIMHNDGQRKLTVGRALKNQLFWDAIDCAKAKGEEKIQQVKGVQSFVLSIEKTGYETCYSAAMMEKVHALKYDTLKELIDAL